MMQGRRCAWRILVFECNSVFAATIWIRNNGVNGFHGVLLMFFTHDLHISLNMTSKGTEYILNECEGSFSSCCGAFCPATQWVSDNECNVANYHFTYLRACVTYNICIAVVTEHWLTETPLSYWIKGCNNTTNPRITELHTILALFSQRSAPPSIVCFCVCG